MSAAEICALGSDVNARLPNERCCPIHKAASAGDATAMKQLLAVKADVRVLDETGGTALHQAARHGHIGVAKALLLAGCNHRTRDDRGFKAAQLAQDMGHTELADLISVFAGGAPDSVLERRLVHHRRVRSPGSPARGRKQRLGSRFRHAGEVSGNAASHGEEPEAPLRVSTLAVGVAPTQSFEELDANGDGVLDRKEWQAWHRGEHHNTTRKDEFPQPKREPHETERGRNKAQGLVTEQRRLANELEYASNRPHPGSYGDCTGTMARLGSIATTTTTGALYGESHSAPTSKPMNSAGGVGSGAAEWRAGLLKLKYMDVDDMLAQLGIYEYAPLFSREKIGLDLIPHLSRQDLKELGLPMGPRVAIWQTAHPGAFAAPDEDH